MSYDKAQRGANAAWPPMLCAVVVWLAGLSGIADGGGLLARQAQAPTDVPPASAPAQVAPANTDAEAQEFAYACDFEVGSDINFDQWPDGWRRQTGPGFPQYSQLKVQPDPLESTNRVMELALDGGQAAVYSPPIEVQQQCSYRLRTRLHVPRIEGHPCAAWASLAFLDGDGKRISEHQLPRLPESAGWVVVESSFITLDHPSIESAIIGLHVQPSTEASLFGKGYFDDVTLQELPKLQLEFASPLHIFSDPLQVKLLCRVSGMQRADADLQFELFDELGRPLRREQVRLNDATRVAKIATSRDGKSQGYAVQQYDWKLADESAVTTGPPESGFYRLVITLLDRETNPLVRTMNFVVLRPESPSRETLFGLSLPLSIIQYDQYSLGAILQQLGVSWIKLPIWLDLEDEPRVTSLGNFLQRLARLEIDVVGILDAPPAKVYQKYWQHEQGIAALTSDVDTFLEAIQPVLIEWSLRIDRWQIGSDQDTGIAENLPEIAKMQKIKEFVRKFGEQTKIGLPWDWMLQRASLPQQEWDFQCFATTPPLSLDELRFHHQRLTDENGRESYVGIQPLSHSEYDLATQVQELCRQMIETKRLPIKRMFVPDPFNSTSGLFDAKNNPTETLLPWRTLAVHLSGSDYLGQIQLPGGSTNHWFAKDGEAFMIAWHKVPVRETLYLGENVVVSDLWGRTSVPELHQGIQSVEIDQWPKLLRGLNLSVALVRLSIQFDRTTLDSIASRQQPLTLSFQNHFPHGINGSIYLSNPELFAQDIRLPFQIGKNDQLTTTAPLQIRGDALTKPHLIQLDFKLSSDDLPSFSAWKPVVVGADDVDIVTRQALDENGRFILMITLINRSPNPVTYTIYLLVPNRKRSGATFYEVPPGQASKSIVLYNAESLLGKTLFMQARDDKGLRSMNYHIKVE
jgi:hypothetical protein